MAVLSLPEAGTIRYDNIQLPDHWFSSHRVACPTTPDRYQPFYYKVIIMYKSTYTYVYTMHRS